MPFNERITNHRRLMKAAMYRLTLIEQDEMLLKKNPDLQLERKIRLIDEYGDIMTELTKAVLGDSGMPDVEPANMVELAEKYYKECDGRLHNRKGPGRGLPVPSLKTFS